PRLLVQARQLHQRLLDLFPVAERINEQALPIPVDRDHQLAGRTLEQALAVARRDDHASLVVQGHFCCTAEHRIGAGSPIIPHFLPLAATRGTTAVWCQRLKGKFLRRSRDLRVASDTRFTLWTR